MTISYSGNFARLLFRWKASVWKTTWKELCGFLVLYYIIRVVYRYALTADQKLVFEQIILDFDNQTRRIPLTFLLGFYVAAVVKRWWDQFEFVPWPDNCLHSLLFVMGEQDDEAKLRRRTIARYLNLSACLVFRDLSVRVRKRFPTMKHLIDAELMTEQELQLYEQSIEPIKWLLPLVWAQSILHQHCLQRNVPAPLTSQFLNNLFQYRSNFHKLYCYDWVCIPLVYTQVSSLAAYGYFAISLFGRQFVEHRAVKQTVSGHSAPVDYYVPLFSILEFLFYIGWFKVGQDLMRPFEEDDDDFELNYILDRNIRVSVVLANSAAVGDLPDLTPMTLWENVETNTVDLPYNVASPPSRNHPPKLHAHLKVSKEYRSIDANSSPVIRRQETKRWRMF